MTLSNQILKALRHGVAKNGKIVMERRNCKSIAKALGVPSCQISGAIRRMLNEEIIAIDPNKYDQRGNHFYWRKGKGCV